MPSLAELVKFRNQLESYVGQLQLVSAVNQRTAFMNLLCTNNPNIDYNRQVNDINLKFKTVANISNEIVQDAFTLLGQVNQDIDLLAEELFNNADYRNRFSGDTLNLDYTIRPLMSDALVDALKIKIKQYCNWQYPGLNLGARFIEWNNCMVTADPLYISCNYEYYLDDLVAAYPATYQRRLRPYAISLNDLTSRLPVNQFGFVLACEVLEYVAIGNIKHILEQVFSLLRPGGVFMFSYNNCDIETSANLADIEAMTYASQRVIRHLSTSIGYEIIQFVDHPIEHSLHKHFSWVEIKRPGVLSTVKAHQVLGQIVEK